MKKHRKLIPLGQTLVEFALILPVFLFLMIVIFDFGRAIYYYNAIHNAAREGARYGVIHPNLTDYPYIEQRARDYAIGLGVTETCVEVSAGTPEFVGNMNNPTIKVTVNYCFTPATPFVDELITPNSSACNCSHLLLSSDAVMRTEELPQP